MSEGITDFTSQRPAIDVVAPALTRHVTFRLLKSENPRFETDLAWDSLLGTLSRHLAQIDDDCGVARAHPVEFVEPSEPSAEGEQRYSIARSAIVTVVDPADGHGYRFRVRVDVYTEMLSVTYLVDAITADLGPVAWSNIVALDDDAPTVDAQARRQALDWLYADFWTSAQALNCMAAIDQWCTDRTCRTFGTRLADLRGVVILAKSDASRETPVDDPGLAPKLAVFVDRHRDGLIAHATGRPDDGRPRSPMAGEPVFCAMLGGEALYIAELGRRNETRALEPVRHLLVFDRSPPPQIGRLVRRLHTLGEFRHAALMDYDRPDNIDLKRISRDLRALGPDLDDELEKSANKGRVIDMTGIIEKVGQLTANADERGLSYRIEQSRYYARQFKKTVEHLRTVRIRHYQSYDDFVARYVYQLFDRIDRIGARYDVFLRRLSLLTTLRLSQEIELYQGTVQDALVHLGDSVGKLAVATEAVRDASTLQNEAANKQIGLLEEAGTLGYAVIVYYAGSALFHVYEAEPTFHEIVSERAFLTVWYTILIAVIVRFAYLGVRNRRRDKIGTDARPKRLARTPHDD